VWTLASPLNEKARTAEALQRFEQLAAGRGRALGARHPDTLTANARTGH
jgi:hypothetical protein